MVEANFVYLTDLVNPYLPDHVGSSIEETVALLIQHATNGKVEYQHTSLNNFATEGLTPNAAKKILNSIDKEKSSLITYLSEIKEDQLSILSKQLKQDGIVTAVYRGQFPRVFNSLFMEELERAKNRKNNRKQKKLTTSNEPIKRDIIESTIKDEKGIFEETFNEIKKVKLPSRSSGMRVFALLPVNGIYSHKKLIRLLRKNLARYIFSRKDRAGENIDLEELSAEATTELRKFVRECNPKTLLGELLVYIFLEHCENAPKIFTKAEFFKNNHSISEKSIFIRRHKDTWQFIIGASNLEVSLESSVKDALKQCEELKDKSDYGEGPYSTNVIQRSVLDSSFDIEQVNQINSLILPKPGNPSPVIQIDSYGIFLGYQIDKLNDEKDELKNVLLRDAEKAEGLINKFVSQHGLSEHPIYLYLVPFKNVEIESDRIVDHLVGR